MKTSGQELLMTMKMQTKVSKDLYSTIEISILLKAASISSADCSIIFISKTEKAKQSICICFKLTTHILQMKLEVKIDSLEQSVDVTKRAS